MHLKIRYRTKKLEKVCTDFAVAQREHGKDMARIIHQRIDQITAAPSVEMLVQYSIGRCHLLIGDRMGEYAMDLKQPYRLVFEVINEEISVARILYIEDYH